MTQEKLIELRKSKGLTQSQMAKLIAMEQTTYSRKETGKSPITNDEWQRFAKALEVSIDDIKEETIVNLKNENCTFSDQTIGIQYVNIPQNVLDIVIKYNQKLEFDNQKLESENVSLKAEIERLKNKQ